MERRGAQPDALRIQSGCAMERWSDRALLPSPVSLSFSLYRHRIHRRFKGNEKNTRVCTNTMAVVRLFRRAIGISAGLENDCLLSFIGRMQLACYQHHA